MKAYTDVNQSKKLSEFLPLESADMGYLWNGTSFCEYPVSNQTIFNRVENIPCWSLAALLDVLPDYIRHYDNGTYKIYNLNLYKAYYCNVSYTFGPSTNENDDTLYCFGRDNFVDACVKMIEKLHEQNLL